MDDDHGDDRNQISFYAEGGIVASGPMPRRPNDVLAIGIAYTEISDRAIGFDLDTNSFSGNAGPIRDHELMLELSYTAELVPGWSIQPDLQRYWHPGGDAPAADGHRGRTTATIGGLRSRIDY